MVMHDYPPGQQQAPPEYLAAEDCATPALSLQTIVSSGTAGSLLRLLRIKPKQPRAIETVDRLLNAGLTLLRKDGIEGCTVEAAAESANISKQLMYRYVSNTPTLLRVIVRWWQCHNLLAFKRLLDEQHFPTDEALAAGLVSGMASRFPRGGPASYKMLRVLAQDYHEIDYAQMVQHAVTQRAAMQRCGLEEASLSDSQIVTALAGLAGMMKMSFITDRDQVLDPAYRRGLERSFLICLRGQDHGGTRV